MKEIEAILDLYRKCRDSGTSMALATVVNKFGSAYRRPGARMLITASGESAGSISGGCVERDLLERSAELCHEQSSKLLTYRAETGDPYDFGSGCEGIIYTLLEPLTAGGLAASKLNPDIFSARRNAQTAESSALCPIKVIECVYEERCTAYSATIFSAPEKRQDLVGKRIVQFQNGTAAIGGNFDNSGLLVEIMLISTKLFSSGPAFTSLIETVDGTFGVFFEKIEPPIKVLIFGAGDDVIPLSAIAGVTGFKHSIIDYRPGLLTKNRFPLAENLIKMRPEQYATRLLTDQFTACVVIHHHYESDKAAVQFLLENTEVPYIGVLGPKKRTVRMLTEMAENVRPFANVEKRRSSLFAPIGLDIGAETPEEIALSIVAEIKAFYRNKTALLLRDKDGPIHEPFESQTRDADAAPEFDEPSGLFETANESPRHLSSVEHVNLQCQI